MALVPFDPSMMALRAGGMPYMGGRPRAPGYMGMPVPHPAMGRGMPMTHPMAMMGSMPMYRRHPYSASHMGGYPSMHPLAGLMGMYGSQYPGSDLYGGRGRRRHRFLDDLDVDLARDPFCMFDEDWWDFEEDDNECDDPLVVYTREMRRARRATRGYGYGGRRGFKRMYSDDFLI